MKHFGANTPDLPFLSQYAHVAYVGDAPTNFAGMIAGIQNVLQLTTVLPGPLNEFTSNAFSEPDSETYIRRMHWGAFQLVMDNSPAQLDYPWQPEYTPQVLQLYRYYSDLHWELVPYLHSLDQAAYENNTPVLLAPNAHDLSMQLGDAIFAKYVTGYVRSVQFTLPPGTWINFWNERQKQTGPVAILQNVPLGKEPIWIKNGSIIPMQVQDKLTGDGSSASSGSLTVRVYPKASTSFRYYDPNNVWVTFQSLNTQKLLTLCTTGAVPSQPLIYKIARWYKAPASVTLQNGAVGVNRGWGNPLPKLNSPVAVQGSSGGWYYDKVGGVLWVKVTQLGTACPSN